MVEIWEVWPLCPRGYACALNHFSLLDTFSSSACQIWKHFGKWLRALQKLWKLMRNNIRIGCPIWRHRTFMFKKCHKKLCAPFAGQVYSERTSAKRLTPLSKLFRVTDSRGLDAISQSPNGGVGSNPTSDTMYCYGANSQSHNPSTPKTRNTFNATAAAPTNSANMMRATKVDREPLQARNAALIAKRARCIPLR